MDFPPIPSWDSIHPLVIHFPIVLLLLAPLFTLAAAALRPPKNTPYLVSALLLLLAGTGSLFVAASTGEATAELADRSPAVNTALMIHEHLASRSEIVFTILSLLFIAVVVSPRLRKLPDTRVISTALPLAFLCFYAIGILYLVNTAHAGGRLVHEFGVHAMMPASDPATGSEPASPGERSSEGD